MNREIKFRGKDILSGEWEYGYLSYNHDKSRGRIVSPLYTEIDTYNFPTRSFNVDINTVGQFTGLHDKNGKEIYEGDILTADHYPFMKDGKMNYLAVVEWFEEDACWYASMQLHKDSTASGISVNCPAEFDKVVAGLYEVTGNIHDNIDLLKDYER